MNNIKFTHILLAVLVTALMLAPNVMGVFMIAKNSQTTKEDTTQFAELTVTGKGTVFVEPDAVEIKLNVETTEPDIVFCEIKHTEKNNKVIEVLKNHGIPTQQITTSTLTLQPIYDYETRTAEEPSGKLTGYKMTTGLTVLTDALEDIGPIVKKALGAGVTRLQSVRYLLSNSVNVEINALTSAVNNANEQSVILSSGNGLKIVGIQSIQVKDNAGNFQPYDSLLRSNDAAQNSYLNTESGLTAVTAEVIIKYRVE